MEKIRDLVAGYCWPGRHEVGDNIFDSWDDDENESDNERNPPSEVLLKEGDYTLIVRYPLSESYLVKLEVGSEGMTRQELMERSVAAYKHVYSFVDKSMEDTKDWNKYGIWGHGIDDLTIHTFLINDETKEVHLDVDS